MREELALEAVQGDQMVVYQEEDIFRNPPVEGAEHVGLAAVHELVHFQAEEVEAKPLPVALR